MVNQAAMQMEAVRTSLRTARGRLDGPTAYSSDDPLVRTPKNHWSEDPLVGKSVIGPKTIGSKKCVIGPTAHWSEKVPLVRKSHLSEDPLVRKNQKPIGPKTHWSEKVSLVRKYQVQKEVAIFKSLNFFSRAVDMLVKDKTDR